MITRQDSLIKEVKKFMNSTYEEAEKIVEKAVVGGEINSESEFEIWLEEKFKPNVVFIDEAGYASMCIDALKILKGTAATDYGSSRQRDFGQMWADMTRGYLAEYAFSKFLKEKFNIESKLGHEKGKLEDFLPMDIHKVKIEGETVFRVPKIKIGIKGTKFNGIWFDIPGNQFKHSDIHVLVKVGTGRDHLFAYFKHISIFKDKILQKGIESGLLTSEEASELYNHLPGFQPITAYVVGFAVSQFNYDNFSYGGKMGRINYKITTWNGPIKRGDLEEIKIREKVIGKVQFESIGEFAHESGYLFNTGVLLWRKSDWKKYVIKNL